MVDRVLSAIVASATVEDRGPTGTGEHEDARSESLMERCVHNDDRTFRELFSRFAPQVFNYLLRLCHHRERAEDLLQITFMKVYAARPSYLAGSALQPWLFAIAKNSFRDELRRKRSRLEILTRDGVLPANRTPRSVPTMELRCALQRALTELSAAHRDAFFLTKIWGCSAVEAGRELRTTPTAVKLRAFYASRRLHGCPPGSSSAGRPSPHSRKTACRAGGKWGCAGIGYGLE